MTRQKMKPQKGKSEISGLGGPKESMRRLGDTIKGKTIVFVVDEPEREDESCLMSCMFEDLGANTKSMVLGYPSLFTDANALVADVLILRSSRLFEFSMDKVKQSLEMFRKNNPDSAVIVCYAIEQYEEKIIPLVDSGLANTIQQTLTLSVTDHDLIRVGAEILERTRGD
jgi:hypothetical protein